jgi:hypothetical protein
MVLEKLSGMREQLMIISAETPYILWPLSLSLSADNVIRYLPQASFGTRAELHALSWPSATNSPFFSRALRRLRLSRTDRLLIFSREEQLKEGERRLAECGFQRAEGFRRRTRESASAEFSHSTGFGDSGALRITPGRMALDS